MLKSELNKSENIAYCPTTEHVIVDLIGLVFAGVPKAEQLSLFLSPGIIVLGNVITMVPFYLIGSLK